MANYRKLGRPSAHRNLMLRNLVRQFYWTKRCGKITL